MKTIFLGILSFYSNFISIFIHQFLGVPPSRGCRFEVSCSKYAQQVIKEYGILRGSLKSIKRLLTCQPFFHGKHI